MKLRKRRVILAVVVLAVLSAGGWYWYHTTTDEYKARQLVAELHECCVGARPGTVRRWLIERGFIKEKEQRSVDEITSDLIALGEASVPALIEALKDENDDVRDRATVALANIGPAAEAAIPALIEASKDDRNLDVWFSTARALSEIGPVAVPDLIQALKDGDSPMRQCAANALGLIGPEAEEAVPTLINLLKSESSAVRHRATSALGGIGSSAKAAVPALIKVLKDEDAYVRYYTADALGEIGPSAAEAIPALVEALKDEDPHVQYSAACALADIAPAVAAREAIPVLILALKSYKGEFWPARYEATRALGKIGPAAGEAVPILREKMKEGGEWFHQAAAEALKKIEVKAEAER